MDAVAIDQCTEKVGIATAQLVRTILERKPRPEIGYRTCLDILRLETIYSRQRLEAVRHRPYKLQTFSYQSVQSILKRSLDRQRGV